MWLKCRVWPELWPDSEMSVRVFVERVGSSWCGSVLVSVQLYPDVRKTRSGKAPRKPAGQYKSTQIRARVECEVWERA
eukprot:1762136-Rhodomonas_salina.1